MVREIKSLLRSLVSDRAYEQLRQFYWRLWDIWHGVETSRFAEIGDLSVVGNNRDHAVNYEPIGSIRKILEELGIDYEKYGFVDMGSGKGRVLLEAAEYPFKSVEGVEFTVELHNIAENNIQNYRGARRCRGVVRSVLIDATEFLLPNTPLVLCFCNPFSGPVLSTVIDNIQKSAVAQPRDIVIIGAGTLLPKEGFERIPNIQTLWRRKYTTVYRLHT